MTKKSLTNTTGSAALPAYLVTPDHERHCATVQVVEVETDGVGDAKLSSLYRLIGCSLVQCLDATGLLQNHVIWMDEEGLFLNPAGYLIIPSVHPLPLAGRLLILGNRFSEDLGTIAGPVTVGIEDVRSLLSGSYCTPTYARAAHQLQEEKIRQQFPSVIVASAYNLIEPATHKRD